MSEALRRYLELEDALVAIRWRHAGEESHEEDRVLERMDDVWRRLSAGERDAMRARPPRSLLRGAARHRGVRALVDATPAPGSHEPARRLVEVA